MRSLLIAGAALAVVGSLSAQTYVTAPAGLLTKNGSSGNYSAYYLGYYTNSRYFNYEPNFKGTVKILQEIGFRPRDSYTYTSTYGMGRTFSNLVIYGFHCDSDNLVTTFSANKKDTPKMVYNAKTSWPDLTTNYGSGVPPWLGSLKHTFTSVFLYNGKDDLGFEWVCNNGVFNNGYTGTGRPYYKDGHIVPTPWGSVYGGATYHPALVGGTNPDPYCADTQHTSTTLSAYAYGYCYLYGPQSTSIAWRNKLRFYHYSYYTAAGAPIIWAWTIGGNAAGATLSGFGCFKLYVDLTKPSFFAVFNTMPKEYSTSAYSGNLQTVINYNPAFSGAEVWFQGAWSDSGTAQPKLTRATHTTIPAPFPTTGEKIQKGQYATSLTATSGYVGTGPFYALLGRYCYK